MNEVKRKQTTGLITRTKIVKQTIGLITRTKIVKQTIGLITRTTIVKLRGPGEADPPSLMLCVGRKCNRLQWYLIKTSSFHMLYFLHDQVLHTASLWICSFQVSHFHFVFMSKRGPDWSLHPSKTTCMTKQNFMFVKLVKGTSLLSFTENGSNFCYFSSCFSAAFYFFKKWWLNV